MLVGLSLIFPVFASLVLVTPKRGLAVVRLDNAVGR